jgi:hypothetical protein
MMIEYMILEIWINMLQKIIIEKINECEIYAMQIEKLIIFFFVGLVLILLLVLGSLV